MRYVEKLWSLRHAISILVVMQAFDTLSTVLALGVGGGEEGNPVMREALGVGPEAMVVAKWAVIALVFAAVAIDPMERPYVRAALLIMNTVYGVVLSGNFAAYGLATGDWMLPVAFWGLVLAMATVAVDEAFFQRGRPAGR